MAVAAILISVAAICVNGWVIWQLRRLRREQRRLAVTKVRLGELKLSPIDVEGNAEDYTTISGLSNPERCPVWHHGPDESWRCLLSAGHSGMHSAPSGVWAD